MLKPKQVINHEGQFVIDSRGVAEMVDRNHKEVLRDIRKIIEHLSTERNFALSEYFMDSSYQDSTGRLLSCYLLTKKGCELFSTRMTGAKGTMFAVAYIEKFNEMEQQLQAPMIVNSFMIAGPIERAKLWIQEEQQEKMLIETEVQEQVNVIEQKQEQMKAL